MKPTREISDAWIIRGIDSKRLSGTSIKGKLTITSEMILIDGDRVVFYIHFSSVLYLYSVVQVGNMLLVHNYYSRLL